MNYDLAKKLKDAGLESELAEPGNLEIRLQDGGGRTYL